MQLQSLRFCSQRDTPHFVPENGTLAPTNDISAAGPFDQWPLARGFDRFYGFLEGETDQFHPELVIDNQHIDAPAKMEGSYHPQRRSS